MEPTKVYTPEQSQFDKYESGISDAIVLDNVYKFMGCSVLSINMSLGFNGTPSSASITMVEDTARGEVFLEPTIPSIWAISLPRGGVGAPVILEGSATLNPNGFTSTSTPFYFCGICTNFTKSLRNPGGKTITVTLVDPREVMSGIQCLLSGFALSQEVGAASRYLGVKNVIDIFGYWTFGLDSNRNEYGLEWSKIREPLENIRVTIRDMVFEFVFTGETFNNVPSWYRIPDETMDLVAIAQRVAQDSGSDFITVGRKIDRNSMVVEIRGIKRTNFNPLTKGEIVGFASSRSSIVESVNLGKEFKNEPNSSIIVGGRRNGVYYAQPSQYIREFHLDQDDKEDYNAFPSDIKVRLFGGEVEMTVDDEDGNPVEFEEKTFELQSGAIYPFWGFTSDDNAYPMIEPFISLHHLVFDKFSESAAHLTTRIPLCLISVKNFLCRALEHEDMFLEGDGLPNQRPFAYVHEYKIEDVDEAGWVRGLPLNTEVLRAALVGEDAFYDIYSLYYPDVAASLGLMQPNWEALRKYVENLPEDAIPDLTLAKYHKYYMPAMKLVEAFERNDKGQIAKGASVWESMTKEFKEQNILSRFKSIIYEHVRQYALDYMGRKFMVVLPRSVIMERIWAGLPVPTRIERPEIEYVVDELGYWEKVPEVFDGLFGVKKENVVAGSEEDQIRRRFMAEDGRFRPMVAINHYPLGNINFNSNLFNKAMFQDLPTSEFRPNRIASGNPVTVYISCTVNQFPKRPDLALVELPAAISFDPTTGINVFGEDAGDLDDEFLATKSGIMKYFWYYLKKDNNLRAIIKEVAEKRDVEFKAYAMEVFSAWAKTITWEKSQWFFNEMSTEFVMDLAGVFIPLTSTWMTYGPYYYTYDDAKGMVDIQVDDTLVPWNFERPEKGQPWYKNLDEAGFERLSRSLSNIDYLDTASISVAGYPEYGPASNFGYNSNLTGISVDFGIGGVKTVYNMATYSARPGTFRKAEYDNLSRARIDTRERLPDIINTNIAYDVFDPSIRNRFNY